MDNKEMELWILGQNKISDYWEVQGIFDSREIALALCTTEDHFVAGPVILNNNVGEQTKEFDSCVYPVLEKRIKLEQEISRKLAEGLDCGGGSCCGF